MTYSILEDLNKLGSGYVSYYDIVDDDFVGFDALCDEPDEGRFIQVPYIEDCKKATWEFFWASLNDEEHILAESFNERHGFFAFLHETGLISHYYAAEEKAVYLMLKKWVKEYNLPLDIDSLI